MNMVRRQDGSPLDPIYRGHADCDWSLIAPNDRGIYAASQSLKGAVSSSRIASKGQINYFRHLATGLSDLDITTLEMIDLEALARHHGLCSNLLDWTSSPYVAAFFAFTTALDRANDGRMLAGTLGQHAIFLPDRPVCIWRLSLSKELHANGDFELLSSLAHINQWQKAQSGCFTRLTHENHLDVVTYLEERNLGNQLERFLIPGSETGKALHDLELMNITYARLFPDLRGAAIQANIGMTWQWLT